MTADSPLSAAGLRVLLLGPLGPPHVSDQALALRDRGFEVSVGGNSPEALTDRVLEEAKVPVSTSPETARSTPWGMAATVRWARRLIAQTRPDVVSAHWLPGFGLAAAAAGASPLALTAWGSDIYRASRPMRTASRYALRRAELVMADSQDLLDRCAELGAGDARREVVQWGVDLRMFGPPPEGRMDVKERLGLGPGPVILSPRSFMPVYNIPTVIEAFGRIGAEQPDAQLVLKHMGAVTIELPELPHPDRVRMVGSVSYEEMVDYYRAADVCVSVTSSDSSPRSIWEAMACGCPCVLSDLPWVDELVRPANAAVTVPVDPGAVAAAVMRILGDPDHAASLARNGTDLVEGRLSRDAQMDRLGTLMSALATGGAV